MQIRRLKKQELTEVVALWYNVSLDAHFFISPDYWKKNKITMEKKYLPKSETYVAIENDDILGFISMRKNNLAALFVNTTSQGQGIGTKLLDYIKKRRKTIQLTVYKKNFRAIKFYQNQGFSIINERKDEKTDEIEFIMEWNG
jgi:putative acetyltransferase